MEETQLIQHSTYACNDDKLLNVVIPTFNGGYKLEVMINCLLAQTSQNMHITIISDGIELETQKQLQRYYHLENFSYFSTPYRYNDYGHTPRLRGLHASNCKFTLMTGFDNYYVPIFIERFERAINSSPNVGFVFCDFVLDHPRDGRKYNGVVHSKLEVNFIDIGNFVAETNLIKQVGLKVNEYAADWHLVNDLLPLLKNNNKTIIKIPQTLYVHN